MQFKTTQKNLGAALSLISSIVNDSTAQNKNNGFSLFQSHGAGEIKITTADQNLTLFTKFEADYDEEIEIGLPFKQLHKIVSLLPDDSIIELKLSKNWIILTSGKSRHRLPTLSNLIFPEEQEFKQPVIIPGGDFHEILRLAQGTVAKENQGSWILRCVSLKTGGSSVRVSSCDGHQATRCVLELQGTAGMTNDALIPAESLAAILKFIDKTEPHSLRTTPNAIKIGNARAQLICRQAAGVFPDVNKLMPSPYPFYFKVDARLFEKTLKRCLASMKIKASVLCQFNVNEVTLTIEEENAGKAEETMNLIQSNFPDDPALVPLLVINPAQILGFLSIVPASTETCVVSFGQMMPIQIIPDNVPFEFTYVTMPVNPDGGEK